MPRDYALPAADIFAVYSQHNKSNPKVIAFVDYLQARFAREKQREDSSGPW